MSDNRSNLNLAEGRGQHFVSCNWFLINIPTKITVFIERFKREISSH
jgi:hypothetical protein